MGNRGDRDDFLPNAGLFLHILEAYYLKKGFTLVLKEVFKVGTSEDVHGYPFPCSEALRIRYGSGSLLVFHGHQVSTLYRKYVHLSGFFVRYVAYPLKIMNYSVSHDKAKKYKVEKKVYDFSSRKKIVSIIGHTHRPLFESLSKIDSVRFKIESLCREYPTSVAEEKARIESLIKHYRQELHSLYKNGKNGNRGSLYNSRILVPCLFNSGCAVGKRGMTSVEITGGEISLVHWFDGSKSRNLAHNDCPPERIGGGEHYRMLLKRERLDYLFARIRLLA
jgi:hypothetical protein